MLNSIFTKLKFLSNIAFVNIDEIVLFRNILFDKRATILNKIDNITKIC